jgi:hypothetical protein
LYQVLYSTITVYAKPSLRHSSLSITNQEYPPITVIGCVFFPWVLGWFKDSTCIVYSVSMWGWWTHILYRSCGRVTPHKRSCSEQRNTAASVSITWQQCKNTRAYSTSSFISGAKVSLANSSARS